MATCLFSLNGHCDRLDKQAVTNSSLANTLDGIPHMIFLNSKTVQGCIILRDDGIRRGYTRSGGDGNSTGSI